MRAASRIISFYWHGFRSMKTGRMLWLIIIIKLIIIFGFLKLVFYPDLLRSRFDSDEQRATYVLENLTLSPEKKRSKERL
jgi:hypothetical protein